MGNNRKIKNIALAAGVGLILTAFQNCSDVSFDQGSGTSASSQSAGDSSGTLGQPGGDDAGGQLGQNGDPNNPGSTPGTTDPGTTPGTGPGTGPVNNPPGGTTPPGGVAPGGTPFAPAGAIPKVVFIGPPCVRGTNCLIAFELDQPYSQTVDFIWYTNDNAYLTPSTPIYGRPNYHYVPVTKPMNQHVTFPPGTVRKEVYVQNINPDNVSILIAVIMSQCTYGGASHNCSTFFRP